MTLEALLFDVDGTLADTEETHRQAFNATFMQFELRWDWSPHEYARLLAVSGGKERILYYIDSAKLAGQEKSRLRELVGPIHRTKTLLYTELIADGRAPLRPGIARLIREAREAGVRVGIVSTTSAANVEALISANLGRDAYRDFAVIACGDQVSDKKPSPDIYNLALATLGLPASSCAAFEDSANGLRAAKTAGLFTVVTPTRWTVEQDFAAADLRLPHLGESWLPLDPVSAQIVGAPYVSLRELDRMHRAFLANNADSAARVA